MLFYFIESHFQIMKTQRNRKADRPSNKMCSGRNKALARLESSELASEIIQPRLDFMNNRLGFVCKP